MDGRVASHLPATDRATLQAVADDAGVPHRTLSRFLITSAAVTALAPAHSWARLSTLRAHARLQWRAPACRNCSGGSSPREPQSVMPGRWDEPTLRPAP